ncbi:hypothetical protein L211DRAFT_459581 [Terfezia boudieri ATCC MYA-4762]|uniref:Endonuclease/exonuclease/phosphatase domain-containing protein n=1 Tax=Terfezia boudieri ATCC MYA-4762 TaxID=1051890 RepID=A0A3N4LSV5_9PEZI|nr:hypothetical protein L211DRAFT_459581 [Terfezia boudieri ATCC MYA-4762]
MHIASSGIAGLWMTAEARLWRVGCWSGFEVADGGGPWTWERKMNGRFERSRIDSFLSRGAKRYGEVESAKLGSDHWAIIADMNWGDSQLRSVAKVVVDWKMLEELVEEKDDAWFERLEGGTPYDKPKTLRKICLKKPRITRKSKRWWDEELTKQLKAMRKSRRERMGEIGLGTSRARRPLQPRNTEGTRGVEIFKICCSPTLTLFFFSPQ